MPAKSEKQRRLMQAVIHDPKVARKTGIAPVDAQRVLGKHKPKRRRNSYFP